MKKLLASLLCLMGLALSAQNVPLVSSPEMDNRVPDGHSERVLGTDPSGTYILRVSGPISNSETVVEQYTNDMKYVAALRIPGSQGSINEAKMHRQTELLKGKILTFHDRWSKSEGASFFSVIPYEMSGKALGEVVLDKQAAAGLFKTPTFKIALSPDGSKLMVLDEVPFEKGLKEKMRIKVFATEGFVQLWSRDVQLENESDRYPNNEIGVDDKGNAFIFKDIKISGKEHLYQLILAGKDAVKTEKVDLQTYFPTEYKLAWDTDGTLLIGGLLAFQGQFAGNWDRVWALKANDKGILFNKVLPISQALLRTHLSEKLALQPAARLNDFKLKAILPRKSGGFTLLAEEFRSTKVVVGTTTPAVYEHSLDFGGIAIIAVDGQGKELWTNYIDKRQSEKTLDEEKYFGSFACHSLDDKVYIVWNYMSWQTLVGVPFRFWIDNSGAKIDIDNLYGNKALQPTLLTVVNPDGAFAYKDRTFFSLPLADIQKANAFPMAMDPHLAIANSNGLVVLSRMAGFPTKKYKFGKIVF